MKSNNFMKSLMLHIRYPWTAICLLILWIGLAVMCAILHFTTEEVILLTCLAGGVTFVIALVGFKS